MYFPPVLNSSTSTTTFTSTDSRGSTVLFTQTFTTSFLASSQTGSVVAAPAIARPSNIGMVMAGVFGGLAFLLLIIVAVLVIRRRRKNTRAPLEEDERGLALKKSNVSIPASYHITPNVRFLFSSKRKAVDTTTAVQVERSTQSNKF
jgi:mannitol-specific phosphotransferase system IIBC component